MSLHLLSMTQTALNAGFTQVGIWTAVVVLACIFGAEIACISILISKMLRAKKQRREEEYEDSYSSDRSNSIPA